MRGPSGLTCAFGVTVRTPLANPGSGSFSGSTSYVPDDAVVQLVTRVSGLCYQAGGQCKDAA